MDTKLLIIFIVLNAFNVIIQTVKSLCTINGSKLTAAAANAIAYGLYTVVVVYMVCELPLLWKVLIIGGCNFIGVYAVKWFEEKGRKDKLWKIEATVNTKYLDTIDTELKKIPHSYNIISSKHTLFNFYCSSQKQSKKVHDFLKHYDARFFVSESKTLY